MNLRYAKRFRAYAKKARLLTVEEILNLGIEVHYNFEGIGFVDVGSKAFKKMATLVTKTRLVHIHTYHEGDNQPYFNDRIGLVNRIGFGLAYGAKATGLHP